jgi:hypothetical protein
MSRSDAIGAAAWPELILSARPFTGGGGSSKAASLDALAQFSRPQEIVRALGAAAERGAGAIMTMNDAPVLHALELCPLPVYPVIPNAIGYVRDATDHGMIGAGIKLIRRMRAGDLLGIGLRGVTSLRRVLLKDFRAILPILIEVEMTAFRRFGTPLVLLHSQVTDLALALGNREAFGIFADVVRRRFGAEPGLVTCNYGLLLPRLSEWDIGIKVIVAPFNSRGFLMKPTRAACEALLAGDGRYVIADRVGAGGTSPSDDLAYVRRLGIRSAVVELGGETVGAHRELRTAAEEERRAEVRKLG